MKIKSYNSNEIGVQFKVWAPTFNRVTHRLYLLGSLKELGAWAIEAALEAFPTTDLHIWAVQAALPPFSRFEWVWLKTNTKTNKVAWERPVKRNRVVGCYSGVLHTVWGAQEEVFLQSVANVDLTTHKKLEDGLTLVLTGGTPTLGNWNMRKAIPATEFPNKSGYWKVSFAFDAFTNLDFKWAVVKDKERTSVVVQEKVPHSLYGRQTWMRVAAPWMTTSTVVVDSLPLNDTLDSKRGRTDLIVRDKIRRLMEIRTWLAAARNVSDARSKQSVSETSKQSPLRTVRTSDFQFDVSSLSTFKASPSRSASVSAVKSEAEEERTLKMEDSDTRSDQFRNFPHVFAIKGIGQTELPTDLTNAGCLPRGSGLVPESESRVLDLPSRTGVSLWSLSMGLVRQSPQVTGQMGKSAKEASGVGAPQQDDHTGSTEGQALRPGGHMTSSRSCPGAEEGRIPEATPPRFRVPENSKRRGQQQTRGILGTSKQGGADDDTGEQGQSTTELERQSTIDDKVVRHGQQKHPNEPSLVLYDIEKCPEKECSMSSDTDTSSDEEMSLPEQTHGELDEQENIADDSEFFKSLEMGHGKDVLDAAEGRPKSRNSDTFMRDSGLSSFGLDVYMSRSSAECTSAEQDTISVLEDALKESLRLSLADMDQLCLSKDLKETSVACEDDGVSCSPTSHPLVDEGFPEPDLVGKSASRRDWGDMPIGPLLEDIVDTSERHRPRPPYWKRLQHRRQISLPFLTISQPESPPGNLLPERSSSDTEASMSSVSVLQHHDEERHSRSRQSAVSYAKGITPPLASSSGMTLGDLYRLYGDSQSWQCWAKGDYEEEEVNAFKEFTPPTTLEALDQYKTDVLGNSVGSNEIGWIPSTEKPSLGLGSPNILAPDSRTSAKESLGSPTTLEVMGQYKTNVLGNNLDSNGVGGFSSTEKQCMGHDSSNILAPDSGTSIKESFEVYEPPAINAEAYDKSIALGEMDDVALCDARPVSPNDFDEVNASPTWMSFDTLWKIPCDELSISERRFVAQAIEMQWGLTATRVGTSERDPSIATAPSEFTQNTTPVDSLPHDYKSSSPLHRPRRYYRAAGYSPSDVHSILDSGARGVDRRAMARQAEKAWGLANSSRCHWAGDQNIRNKPVQAL